MIEYILLLIILLLIVIIIILVRKEQFSISDVYFKLKDKVNNLLTDEDDELDDDIIVEESQETVLDDSVNDKYYKDTTFFTSNLFHPDYVDVINVINSLVSSPSNPVFNKDNQQTTISEITDTDDINMISDSLEKIIDNINERIDKQPKTTDERIANNEWINYPEMKYEDGFESVRQSLGLPTKLYNTSISGNHIEMCSYSSAMIETINITNESEYSCDVVIKRDGSRDKMMFNIKFIIDNSVIVIDKINIIGFEDKRAISDEYKDSDELYEYKELDHHNITPISDILSSIKTKYDTREKMMQDNIDNLHPEDKIMNMRINPYQYEGIKQTRTYYDDIWEKPLFE